MSTKEQQKESVEEPEVEVEVEEQDHSSLESMMSEMREDAEDATVTDFTAVFSGVQHGHGAERGQGEGNHDVRSRWNVRDEFVSAHFISQPNDHAAIHEMVIRKKEFKSAEEDMFEDTGNKSRSKWNSIENFAQSGRAPIPEEARQKLRTVIAE